MYPAMFYDSRTGRWENRGMVGGMDPFPDQDRFISDRSEDYLRPARDEYRNNFIKRGWYCEASGLHGQFFYSINCSQNYRCNKDIIDRCVSVDLVNCSNVIISHSVNCLIFQTGCRVYSHLNNMIIIKETPFDFTNCIGPGKINEYKDLLASIRKFVENMHPFEWGDRPEDFLIEPRNVHTGLWIDICNDVRTIFQEQYNHLFGKAKKAEEVPPADAPTGDSEI